MRRTITRTRRSSRASSTRTRTSSTRCTPASGTGSRLAPGSARTSSARTGSSATTCSPSHGSAFWSRFAPGSRPPPTTASPAPPRPLRPSSGCGRSSTSRCSRSTRRRPSAQFDEKRDRVEETDLVRIGVSPHAPYSCSLDTYRWCLSLGIPVGTHLAESANENEWLEHGSGPLQGIAPILVPPTGKRAVASLEPVLGPDLLCAHCVEVDAGEIALLAERNVAGRPLPALERPARLRHRPGRRAPRRGRPRRARHGLPGVDAVLRHVRGDAHRDLPGPGPDEAPGGASSRPMRCAWPRSTQPGPCESRIRWVP